MEDNEVMKGDDEGYSIMIELEKGSIADILILLQILSIIYRSFANHFSILSHSIILVV